MFPCFEYYCTHLHFPEEFAEKMPMSVRVIVDVIIAIAIVIIIIVVVVVTVIIGHFGPVVHHWAPEESDRKVVLSDVLKYCDCPRPTRLINVLPTDDGKTKFQNISR